MMYKVSLLNSLICIMLLSFFSCKNDKTLNEGTSTQLIELSPLEYPDNPDSENKHPLYEKTKYSNVNFLALNDSLYNITLIPENNNDTILLTAINLMEYLPTVNCAAEKDKYITYIDLINQEWNRNQVQFKAGEFEIKSANTNKINRVDIARNCLNAYLWEVILFAEIEGEQKPYYHAWFNFPKQLYSSLFEKRNKLSYSEYQKPLENWIDIESKVIDLSLLRSVQNERELKFINLNYLPYALKGERKKKFKNIIYPKNTSVIQNFLTDSTLFSTFSPPGIYNTKDPRKTELAKLSKLDHVFLRNTIAPYYSMDTLLELELIFNADNPTKQTHFFISGILPIEIPTLDTADVNKGWQNSMGIGNHTFYESYKNAQTHSSSSSPYFSILTDKNRKWVDSHKIGIDGPLLHWDINDKNKLHIWILSFERHAFVGHYVISLK